MTEIKPCPLCPDWTAWERDLKKAAKRDAAPISDVELDRFRHALADVHCKSSSQERDDVEYRLMRFGAKMWRPILARLDAAEANQRVPDPALLTGLREAREALQAMMDAWLDYHDARSLTQPVSGRSANAFDKALGARGHLDTLLAQEGES